jgi:apolipoprotein N-acyltransferase
VVAAFAGVLFAFSFEPIGLWFLAPIAYAIFLRVCQKGGNLYRRAFLFGFISSAITLWWAGKYVGFLPLALLALLHGLFYLPLGFLSRYTNNILWFIPALLAIEELRSHFPFGGFSWMRIAFSQVDAPFASVITIGGALLLSAWVLVISSMIATLHARLILPILLMLFLPLFLNNTHSSVNEISFVGIQGNTPSVGLAFNDRAEAVFNLHVTETRKVAADAADAADVIIWPENAIDVDPFANSRVSTSIESLTSALKTPLITGAITRQSGQLENVSLMYNESGEVVSYYSKQYLTPFGEYMPLRSIARIVSPYVDDVVDFSVGDKVENHVVNGLILAPVICYELLSDSLVQSAAKSSNALVVQTNSATFANTSESAQQLSITRLRALENAREIVSVSTIGISAHIGINGEIVSRTGENVSAQLSGDLQSNSNRTLANLLGGYAPGIVLLISMLLPLTLRIVRSR